MGEPGIAPRGGDFAGEFEEHLVEQFGGESSLRLGEACTEIVETLPAGKLFHSDATILEHGECGFGYLSELDNSASTYPINSAGKILVNGLDLLDPRQPFWHGKTPDVKWPK